MKKFKIHPSFFLLIAICLISKDFILLINYICALSLHEFAHLFVATKRGYSLKVLRVSMWGLSIDLNEKIDDKDQFAINIAGPVMNLFVCLICLATYWLIPQSYVYFNTFCFVNFVLALFNLLPIYPLDGGKIFNGIVKSDRLFRFFNILIKVFGTVGFFIMFLITLKVDPNYMFLLISLTFLTLNTKRIPTASIFKQSKQKKFDKVIIIKADEDQILLELVKKIRSSCFTIFYVEKTKIFIDENEVVDYAIKHSLTNTLKEVK